MSEQVGFVPLMIVGDLFSIEVTQKPSNDFKVSVQTRFSLLQESFPSFVEAKKWGLARAAVLLMSDLRELVLADLIAIADPIVGVWRQCDAEALELQLDRELERIRARCCSEEYQRRLPAIEEALGAIRPFLNHLRSLPPSDNAEQAAMSEQVGFVPPDSPAEIEAAGNRLLARTHHRSKRAKDVKAEADRLGMSARSYVRAERSLTYLREGRELSWIKMGMRIEADGKAGVVIGGDDCVLIRYEDGKTGRAHPAWRTRYFDEVGKLIAVDGKLIDCAEDTQRKAVQRDAE